MHALLLFLFKVVGLACGSIVRSLRKAEQVFFEEVMRPVTSAASMTPFHDSWLLNIPFLKYKILSPHHDEQFNVA